MDHESILNTPQDVDVIEVNGLTITQQDVVNIENELLNLEVSVLQAGWIVASLRQICAAMLLTGNSKLAFKQSALLEDLDIQLDQQIVEILRNRKDGTGSKKPSPYA